MIWVLGAVVLGLIILVVRAQLTSPLAEQPDPAMVWEARVAVGSAALVFVGPFWLAQGVHTAVATSVTPAFSGQTFAASNRGRPAGDHFAWGATHAESCRSWTCCRWATLTDAWKRRCGTGVG